MRKYLKYLLVIVILLFAVKFLYLKTRYKNSSFILIYHKIDNFGGGSRSLYVTKVNFENQMGYLYRRGYRTVSLQELAGIIKNKKRIPEKIFAITFDDGYENNYTNAMPLLKKYGFRATVFLSAGYIGKSYGYPGQAEEQHMDKKQIEGSTEIFDFGSHTVTHPDLTKIREKEVTKELLDSRFIISRITNKTVKTFAYPFGSYDKNTEILLEKTGYTAACTSDHGLVTLKSNIYELPRFEFKEFKSMSPKDFFKNIDFYLKTFFSF